MRVFSSSLDDVGYVGEEYVDKAKKYVDTGSALSSMPKCDPTDIQSMKKCCVWFAKNKNTVKNLISDSQFAQIDTACKTGGDKSVGPSSNPVTCKENIELGEPLPGGAVRIKKYWFCYTDPESDALWRFTVEYTWDAIGSKVVNEEITHISPLWALALGTAAHKNWYDKANTPSFRNKYGDKLFQGRFGRKRICDTCVQYVDSLQSFQKIAESISQAQKEFSLKNLSVNLGLPDPTEKPKEKLGTGGDNGEENATNWKPIAVVGGIAALAAIGVFIAKRR